MKVFILKVFTLLVVLAICMLFIAQVAQARVVWENEGFMLETRGWLDKEMLATWTGVHCGLTIPRNGYFAILKPGALELFINGKWVKDQGILITDGCPKEARGGGDTLAGTCNITNSSGCKKEGGRIILLVRIPKMFPTPSSRPTKARWVERKVMYDVQTYR